MPDLADQLEAEVKTAQLGHSDGWHEEHGYEWNDDGAPYCPECDTAAAALDELRDAAPTRTLALAKAIRALDGCEWRLSRLSASFASDDDADGPQSLKTVLNQVREAIIYIREQEAQHA